jgi:hypothetical protein
LTDKAKIRDRNMAFIHAKEKVIECTIVYYAPGRGGKITNQK